SPLLLTPANVCSRCFLHQSAPRSSTDSARSRCVISLRTSNYSLSQSSTCFGVSGGRRRPCELLRTRTFVVRRPVLGRLNERILVVRMMFVAVVFTHAP